MNSNTALNIKEKRCFVPITFDENSPEEVENLYKTLADAVIDDTAESLRAWILKWSELDSVLAEISSRRYVAMTCDTADEQAAAAFSDFVEKIDPIQSKYHDILNKKLIGHPACDLLKPEFEMFFRSVRVSLDLFNQANIPLEVAEQKEVQAYQKITGAMSVEFQGKTHTLQQMNKYLESTDRDLRKNSWLLVQNRRLQDKEALDSAFDKLFALRHQIALNAGCKDYVEYIFKAKNRFDYTPADCKKFHDSIEKIVLPLLKKIHEKRATALGLKKLRPYDLVVDSKSRPALNPFQSGEELIEKCCRIYEKLNGQAGTWLRYMQKEHLIDPDSRLGKAPGGYQIGFDESRLPFIFMNAAGSDRDIYTLLHEGGHSFHQFAMANQPIVAYRDIPSEFAEVASMSMELIGSSEISEFYPNAEDAARSRQNCIEDVIELFPWIASIDSFQHELYVRPNHTAKDREKIWLSIMDRYDAGIDYSGYEMVRANLWQKQLHIFECPFYYVEYGIAQLGALQVWANFKKDKEVAFRKLFEAESLGSSRPLPELFARAGIRFDFSAATLEPLLETLWTEYEKFS